MADVSAHFVHIPDHCVTWCPAWRAARMSEPSDRPMWDGMAVAGNGDGLPRQRKAVNPCSPTLTGGPHVFISVRGCSDNNAEGCRQLYELSVIAQVGRGFSGLVRNQAVLVILILVIVLVIGGVIFP